MFFSYQYLYHQQDGNFNGASNEGGLYVPNSNPTNGKYLGVNLDDLNIGTYQVPQNDGTAEEIELDQNTTAKRLTRQVRLIT